MTRAAFVIALALALSGCREKPKIAVTNLQPIADYGIQAIGPGRVTVSGEAKITINWTAIQALIPRGCVIGGLDISGIPSGYILRASPHHVNAGSPWYWCDPKWERKP